MKQINTDILIVGSGVSGLFAAINLPRDKKILIITKVAADKSDSFLAQGGICVQRDGEDFEPFFEDTLKAGHGENDKKSVEIMIKSSREIINDLISYGVEFEKNEDGLCYTREGAHSKPRILYNKDETGKEITSKLLKYAKTLDNVKILEYNTLVDLIMKENCCLGGVCKDQNNELYKIKADYTLLATGGIGGLFKHSTNFSHLTGDGVAIAIKQGIELKDIDYIQIHPTVFYVKNDDRMFLISESVRGEGAILLNKKGERFVNELLPRDKVAAAITSEMEREGSDYVRLSLAPIDSKEILSHFPNIYNHCKNAGYDILKEPIPVVPAQHYFMGGIKVDEVSKTSADRLYALGETACNGVHGKNRLASNSLLESLVFAKKAAENISRIYEFSSTELPEIDADTYINYENTYKNIVLAEIERKKKNG